MTRVVRELIREATTDGSAGARAAGRLMSLAEDEPERVFELIAELSDVPDPRLVLGITGAPGSGKSLLIDRLIATFRARYPERRIGVIAVDPSSPLSRGALLGDRIRMMRHATDQRVFIRSAASRGHLGGVSLGVIGMLRVMGLMGCDAVLLETVGVGQSENDVKTLSDLVAVVLAPGQGDVVQFLKAGLMEVGDLYLVNKADLSGAVSFHAELLATLRLLGHGAQRLPEDAVRLVSALNGHGVAALLDFVEQRAAAEQARWALRRGLALRHQARKAVLETARERIGEILDTFAEADTFGQLLRAETTVSELVATVFQRAAGMRS